MDELDAESTKTKTHVPKTIFAVKLVNEEFVVEYPTFVDTGVSSNAQLKENLKQFRAVLDRIKADRYDRAIISQLMEAQTKVVIYEPNRKIQALSEELQNALTPLQNRLDNYKYILGTDECPTAQGNHT